MTEIKFQQYSGDALVGKTQRFDIEEGAKVSELREKVAKQVGANVEDISLMGIEPRRNLKARDISSLNDEDSLTNDDLDVLNKIGFAVIISGSSGDRD